MLHGYIDIPTIYFFEEKEYNIFTCLIIRRFMYERSYYGYAYG
mgnify:CR=1 FL=1